VVQTWGMLSDMGISNLLNIPIPNEATHPSALSAYASLAVAMSGENELSPTTIAMIKLTASAVMQDKQIEQMPQSAIAIAHATPSSEFNAALPIVSVAIAHATPSSELNAALPIVSVLPMGLPVALPPPQLPTALPPPQLLMAPASVDGASR